MRSSRTNSFHRQSSAMSCICAESSVGALRIAAEAKRPGFSSTARSAPLPPIEMPSRWQPWGQARVP